MSTYYQVIETWDNFWVIVGRLLINILTKATNSAHDGCSTLTEIFFFVMITAADMTRNDKITVLLQKRQEHDVRELNKAVNEFRQSYQQPYDRREFDLNDPDSLKKDKPARVSDDDPRCGVASLQKFVGEDLNGKAREKLQQEQAR